MIQNNLNKDLEKKIDLYLNGRLSEEEIDALWVELIQDGYYLDYMKSVANLKAVIEEKRETKTPGIAIQLRKYAGYVSAAAVVIFVGVLGVMNYSSGTTSPVSPIPEVGLDIVRSDEGISVNITNEVIKKAIQLAADGSTQEAKDLLSSELTDEEDPNLIAEFSITLGSIQYNLGEYREAASNFKNATEQKGISESTLEKGYWLLANSYFQLDQLEEAKIAFQNTYDLDRDYSRIAKTYINALNAMDK
jgi:tetratricopeptide (TPR) repeat protein